MLVTLRPVLEADLDALATREREVTSPFDDFGFRPSGSLRRSFDENGCSPDGERGRLAVLEGGTLVGAVSWHPVQYGPNPGSRAFNIGLGLFPDRRGKGIGARALQAIARYLFAHFVVERLEGSTDVENLIMQRACERAGFRKEGILRAAQYRLGAHHDLVLYSLLRSELATLPSLA